MVASHLAREHDVLAEEPECRDDPYEREREHVDPELRGAQLSRDEDVQRGGGDLRADVGDRAESGVQQDPR